MMHINDINEKLLAIIGCTVSSLSLLLGLVAIFNDRLVGGMILAGASLVIFMIVFIFFLRRHGLKTVLDQFENSIVAKSSQRLEELGSQLSGYLAEKKQRGLSPFQDIVCEHFVKELDCDSLSSIHLFAHTGARMLEPLFSLLEESETMRARLKHIPIRILLRNPGAEIGSRATLIRQTVGRIREYQKKGFNRLLLQFYEDLPTFRSIVCQGEQPHEKKRLAFLSFYYFPGINSISRKFPRALLVDENKTGTHHLVDIYESWFHYFWGKNLAEEQPVHTLILDFDDTMVQSHDIQVEAWVELIGEARTRFNLTPTAFNETIREVLHDKARLKRKVKSLFFRKQDAGLIFPEIFTGLDAQLTDMLHQRRFEIRERKVREESSRLPLFPRFLETLIALSEKYNLIIVSATDEDMIIDYLSAQRLPSNARAGKDNLYELFRYVFGKQEPAFDWKNMKRKSRLIVKIINILGIPLERMVYVGDNQGDFTACRDIGIQFVEARLFQEELRENIDRESLIFDESERYFFTDWSQFPGILKKIEQLRIH
jgi:phosphoglycolate phosphatase-like HAD superfamily hydrolase